MTAPLRQAYEAIQAGDMEATGVALERARIEGCDPFEWLTVSAGAHMRQRQFERALAILTDAAGLRPLDFTVHYNIGLCLYELGRFADACAAYRRALLINPTFAKAWMKLGGAHLPLRDFTEALACQERAVAMDPTDAELRIGLGTTISLFDDDAGAAAQYRRALELNPDAFEAEIALGFVLLRSGEWTEGWQRFEARSKLRPFGAAWNHKAEPFWTGKSEQMRGKRVLLRAEQGYGDTIQFARYIALVAKRAAEVVVEAPLSLLRLLIAANPHVEHWTAPKNLRDDFEIETSLMSLPLIFGTRPDHVPVPASFRVEKRDIGARIGICWHGGAREHDRIANADDQRRSIPWHEFHPIADIAPCVSLQEEDLAGWGCKDWEDTAAIVKGLDLVITVDTAIAHLAGSLGVETWLLSRAGGCWRWGSSGERTPWYPSMRIYRQQVLCEWGPTVARVVSDLKAWVKRHG